MIRLAHTAALGVLFLASAASASQEDDLDKLRQRITALQDQFNQTSDAKSDAADALRESERAISDRRRAVMQIQQRQQAARKEWQALQQQSRSLSSQTAVQQALFGHLLYLQYLEKDAQDYFRLLLDGDDPNQISHKLRYYAYINRSRAASIKTMRNNLEQLQKVSAQARTRSDALTRLQAEEHAGLQQLEADKRTRQRTLQRIGVQLRQQQREIGRLQRNEKRLTQLMEQLARLAPSLAVAPFPALRGKLALPVQGRPLNRFGARRPQGGLMWTGWVLRAPANQTVKAIAPGRVVYADWLRGYGNLMVIDHGQGYMSLYGNNEALLKQTGDELHAGDTIATVGNSGGNENSGLYFELRHEGRPLDPALWMRHR